MGTVPLYVCSFQRYIFRALLESSVLFAVVSFRLSYYSVLFIHCCFKLLIGNRISDFVSAAGDL